jgi:hypothetical protein
MKGRACAPCVLVESGSGGGVVCEVAGGGKERERVRY